MISFMFYNVMQKAMCSVGWKRSIVETERLRLSYFIRSELEHWRYDLKRVEGFKNY